MRSKNFPAIERLADCLETESCGHGEENVILLVSNHFGEPLTPGGAVGSRDGDSRLQSLGRRWLPRPDICAVENARSYFSR